MAQLGNIISIWNKIKKWSKKVPVLSLDVASGVIGMADMAGIIIIGVVVEKLVF